MELAESEIWDDRSLLLVDDDDSFLKRLARAMEKRGFEVETAGSLREAAERLASVQFSAVTVMSSLPQA